jgi:hypothetical protein
MGNPGPEEVQLGPIGGRPASWRGRFPAYVPALRQVRPGGARRLQRCNLDVLVLPSVASILGESAEEVRLRE